MAAERLFFGRVEAVRGLGALLVAGYHFTGWELLPARAAMVLFFVVSGLVLRHSLEHGPQTPGAASARFVLGRAFRVFPIVIVSTLLVALAARRWPVPGADDPGTVLANVLLLDASLNPVLWTLQVEIVAVPIILALYFLERRFGVRWLLLVLGLTTALSFAPGWAFWPPLSQYLFAIALGMTLPSVGRALAASMSDAAQRWATAAAIAGLVLPGPLLGFYSQWSLVFNAYAAGMLLVLLAYRPSVTGGAWLDHPSVLRFGSASGSYYVYHMLVWGWLVAVLGGAVPAWLMPPLVLLVMVPFALASHAWVELPGIASGRKVRALLQRRQDAPPPPQGPGPLHRHAGAPSGGLQFSHPAPQRPKHSRLSSPAPRRPASVAAAARRRHAAAAAWIAARTCW